MAMRERQLGALGMQTNDKGQVVASGAILQQMEDLGDETGLVCVICREGYKFKPNMVRIFFFPKSFLSLQTLYIFFVSIFVFRFWPFIHFQNVAMLKNLKRNKEKQ